MTAPLDRYAHHGLRDEVFDLIARLPDEPRQAAAAFPDQISVTASECVNTDGQDVVVLDVGWVDEDGAHPLARLDAARFGFHAGPDGITIKGEQ